jgi:EF-P beta-lysylation protein EpmB
MPTAAVLRDPPPARWQRELADAIRDPGELCAELGLDPRTVGVPVRAAADFPLLVPRPFVQRMRPGDPHDPLLLQVLPQREEDRDVPGFTADPLDESEARAAPGLVRKYAGRALVLVTGGCAVNCRYCFRREFPYAEAGATRRGVEEALDAIEADPTLAEVILSGGDPLLADDAFLRRIVERLDGIPHVRRLRIHSRLPVVLPSRIDAGLLDVLRSSRLARVVVIHANHPAELDDAVAAALRRLADAPAVLLNQAVLLAGVNDSAAVLAALSARLVELGVVPYYLHLLDRVRGASHFEVAEPRARELHRELRDTLPGYAVPRLVREVPGEPAKRWLA